MGKIRVFLIRHGLSEANLDWSENQRKADHAISLVDEGHAQAREAGQFLSKYLTKRFLPEGKLSVFPTVPGIEKIPIVPMIRMWNSPYLRTRQTAEGVLETCILPKAVSMHAPSRSPGSSLTHKTVEFDFREQGESWFLDEKSLENFILHEQQFGIFDGLSDEERAKNFPVEWGHYIKCKTFEGKVWARPPGGESRMDCAIRMHHAFGTFQRDAERHRINNIVVVGHGTTNRAFTMAWCHHPWEFLEKEPNPNNCSIRLLEDGKDKGYIFDGFPN